MTEKKRVGFACGVFDLFHAGHLLMFKECKTQCDYLVVGLNRADNIDPTINPGKKPPVFTYDDRKMILEHCDLVDEVIPYNSEEELIQIMTSRAFDVRFLGDDYRDRPITGPGLVPDLYYTDRSHGMSTSSFKKKIAETYRD